MMKNAMPFQEWPEVDANVPDATDKTNQDETKTVEKSQGRILIYPAEVDAENELEYSNFQRWCQEAGRDVPSWPPEEKTHNKGKEHNRRDDENDEDSDEDSDDDDDWFPEQYQVASDPMPTEATMSRPIEYLLFRNQAERLMESIVKSLSRVKKTAKMSPLQEAVMKKIQENRETPRIASLLKTTSILVRVSVLRSFVPVYRDIQVPSNMNLHMLQTRVLCPIFDWDAETFPQKYIFYLPHTCYPSQRRPLSTFKDIVFTVPYQDDYIGMMITHNPGATEAEVINASDVCLADFLQEVGHTLYYQHNLTIPVTLQFKVLQINQEEQKVELIGGVGISPPEDNLITDGPFEQEITGIDAFNLAIKWLQSATIHESYKKEAKRLLQVKDLNTFDPATCDLPRAREKLDRSIRHSTAKTHLPITARQSMARLFLGNPGAMRFPVVVSLGMCKTCLKENIKLQKCGRCKSVFYCSKECQKKDWKSHKAVCARC